MKSVDVPNPDAPVISVPSFVTHLTLGCGGPIAEQLITKSLPSTI
jgi:hypothetical protein